MFTRANKIVSNNDWLYSVACHTYIQEASCASLIDHVYKKEKNIFFNILILSAMM